MITGDMKVSIDTGSGLLSHLIKYFILLFTFGSSDIYIAAELLMASIVHSFQ